MRSTPNPDLSGFVRAILPGLQDVPLRRIAKVTGLTVKYCSLIRRGVYVPHPRHWKILKSIAVLEEDLHGGKISESTEA